MKSTLAFVCAAALMALCSGQDQPGAKWMPSPHHYNGRNGYTPKWLIIHGTAGGSSAEAIGNWFQNPDAGAATHYVVGQNGVVVQCVREADGAWGNGRIENGADPWWGTPNPNYVTISIEHVKPSTDNSDLITEAQKIASFNLVKDILKRNPYIKPKWADSTGGITGHFSISPISRERCPGPYPWDELFAFLNNGEEVPPKCYGTVVVQAGVNIRASPNTQSAVLGAVPYGQTIELTGRASGESIGGNPKWYNYGGGYVTGVYLSLGNGGPSWCN